MRVKAEKGEKFYKEKTILFILAACGKIPTTVLDIGFLPTIKICHPL